MRCRKHKLNFMRSWARSLSRSKLHGPFPYSWNCLRFMPLSWSYPGIWSWSWCRNQCQLKEKWCVNKS